MTWYTSARQPLHGHPGARCPPMLTLFFVIYLLYLAFSSYPYFNVPPFFAREEEGEFFRLKGKNTCNPKSDARVTRGKISCPFLHSSHSPRKGSFRITFADPGTWGCVCVPVASRGGALTDSWLLGPIPFGGSGGGAGCRKRGSVPHIQLPLDRHAWPPTKDRPVPPSLSSPSSPPVAASHSPPVVIP